MDSKRVASVLAVILFTASAGLGADAKPTLKSVGSGLVCQCGCNGIVSEPCQHYDCAVHAEMRALIEKEIAQGKDETAIRQDFALRYGVQVLATPPAKGFSLAVWILPGFGLLGGLALVVVIVRRWRARAASQATPPATEIDARLLAAVEDEMKASGLRARD